MLHWNQLSSFHQLRIGSEVNSTQMPDELMVLLLLLLPALLRLVLTLVLQLQLRLLFNFLVGIQCNETIILIIVEVEIHY